MNIPMGNLGTLSEENLQRPAALKHGDRIGVIAPASPLAAMYTERFKRGLSALAEVMKVEISIAEQVNTLTGITSGDLAARTNALLGMIADPSIKAIFCTIGGFNSAEILPLLDIRTIRENAKIIVGYSDITALLLGLQAVGNWYVFHGPMVLTQFGEYPFPHTYTINSLIENVSYDEPVGEISDPDSWTDEFLDWGTKEWLERPRNSQSPASRSVWRTGFGKGRLFGGNIETLNMLVGTPYFLPPEEIIFFWEATEAEATLPRVRRALTHLKQIGLFHRVRGMLIGRSPDCKPMSSLSLQAVVLECMKEFDFPIIADLAFGHTDPIMTLPIGALTEIVAESGSAMIKILEAAVTRAVQA